MSKIKLERTEYERLLRVEADYHTLLRQMGREAGAAWPKPGSHPVQTDGEQKTPTAPQAPSLPLDGGKPETAALHSGPVLLSEETFHQGSVYEILKHLTVLFKLTGPADSEPRCNTVYFLDGPDSGSSIQFTANDFRANMALKNEARRIIWRETEDCVKITRLWESRLECETAADRLVAQLADRMRREGATPLLAIVHGRQRPRLSYFWLHRETGEDSGAEGEKRDGIAPFLNPV